MELLCYYYPQYFDLSDYCLHSPNESTAALVKGGILMCNDLRAHCNDNYISHMQ